jgi:hypothetical protein
MKTWVRLILLATTSSATTVSYNALLCCYGNAFDICYSADDRCASTIQM